jgi:hypothetical protein
MNEHVSHALLLSFKMNIIGMILMTLGFVVSIMAESFSQEAGYPQSMLGHNRDWLVDTRWWFVAAGVGSLLMAISSIRKLIKHNEPSDK